jgi:Ca2+-binding RTX toxin-like protein
MTSPNSSNTTSKFNSSGNVTIDPLLNEASTKWGYGKSTVYLSFSFPWINGNLASWQNNYSTDNPQNATYHFGLNSIQQQAARDALQSWSNVANIQFSEVSESSVNVGDFRFAFSSALESSTWGYSFIPDNYWASSADVWINSDLGNDTDWGTGTFNYNALMHEIGHGLGLKHPGNYDGDTVGTSGPYLSSTLDNGLYTIMSYNDPINNDYYGNINGKYTWLTIYPETPMVLDIAATQYIYGVNNSYKTGDDVYTFNPSSPFIKTIWDAGGDDTIDTTNFSTNCVIDLIPGNYSSIRFAKATNTGGRATYDGTSNLGIAYNCYIENAKCGSGNDQIIGNDFSNELDGGDGNDFIIGGGGNDFLDWDIDSRKGDDTLSGGIGNDWYCIQGNDYIVEYPSEGVDTVFVATNYSIINTYLENIRAYSNSNENLQFTGNSFDNFLQGALGNDTLIGGNGNDTIDGGDGIDTVVLNGNYADYNKSFNNLTNAYTFIKNTGISTTDYISNIEIFKFTNRTLKAANLFDLPKAPTLNSFSSAVANGIEDNSVTISFSNLLTQGDENDSDGTVDAFIIKSVNSGILKIGTSEKTAINWDANSNNIIDSTHIGYWIPAANANGFLNIFTTTVKDNEGLESTNAVQAFVNIKAVNDAPTGSVAISGNTLQNQVLIVSNTLTDNDGLGSINYQWQSNGFVIPGAIQSSYILAPSDSGKVISVKASYTDQQNTAESVISSTTAKIENVNDSSSGNVTITGAATQNQTLTVSNTLADADGLGIINYQWLNNGNTISNATQSKYTLTQADVGKSISVKASYVDGFGTAESVTSSTTAKIENVNDSPTGSVIITGTVTQNQTLTVSNTFADADGLGSINYQWLSNGNTISNATQSKYTLTQADVGKSISVKASYVDGFGTAENVISSTTAKIENVNDSPSGNVTITGTATQNQTLTVSNTLADADGLGIINYQWLNNGNTISNATQSKYTLTQADVGKSISVKASYVDGFGAAESVTSSTTAKIENVNDLPTGDVTISGIPKNGQILSVTNTLNDLDGMGAVTYKWISDNNTLSTDANYKLSLSNAGKTIIVSANYIDATGISESVSSPIINVARIIDEPLAYANEKYTENPSMESNYSYPAFEPLNNLVDNLSELKWTSPIYDDTQPSYNLTFNSIVSPNIPVGLFIINHNITGDYINASNEINNGTITDSVTASYGAIDKSTFSINESTATKLDSNQKPISKKYSGTFAQSMRSSNMSIDDTTDDYNHTINYSKSSTYIYKTAKYTDTAKYSSVYQSQNINYSSTWNGSTIQDILTTKLVETGKISYSNHDIDYGTVKANFNFVNSKTNDITTKTYSAASFSLNSDDKSTASSLIFSGSIVSDTDQIQIQVKSFTLDIPDMKMISSAIPTTIIDSSDVFDKLSDLIINNQGPELTIHNTIDFFHTLIQGANTITIKNVDGIEVDAGEGKDTIIGSIGNDTIIGGLGSDKLTGGKGIDTFVFNNSDFFTENTNGDLVFNKSTDTITDFNIKEEDTLEFGGLGELGFYATLKEAIADESTLFYVKGSGKIYLNTDTTGEKYTATPIIMLTGNPKVNLDITGWDYTE